MPADPQRAREMFLHAVGKLPPEQWEAYVAEACGPDAELRRHVLHLLEVHREAGSFLERPAAGVAATGVFTPPPEASAAAVPTEAAGTAVGPYKLLELLGEGGMGAVWMAQQTEPVKRLVALKVIKAGMDSRQVLARFEAERQALALMDHANIARVFDGGTTAAGRPYFVMELIRGVPVTRYCDEHRLTPKQRLELFLPVCQAIQHAHQKGVIHRDLKPSNVLVALYDGTPVPKVIDFGIAKAAGPPLTEHTLVTGFGNVVGTLEYMSPEQAELNQLDIDTRSDVYSLGVLLYELLTGTTPLEKKRLQEAALLEVLRVIREEEPPRPSTRISTLGQAATTVSTSRRSDPKQLSRLCRGELDWVVMKALEKDRNRRYESASAFAADVQSYLADEPVSACPPSLGYRFRKFTRRNKGGLTAAALVALALIAGTVVSTWQAIRATNALERERETRSALDQERNQLNGRIGDALMEMTGLREKVQSAGPADGQHWAELQDAARRTEALAASDLADPALIERARGLLKQVRQDGADRQMLARVEALCYDSLPAPLGAAARPDLGAAFAGAFGDYGLPVADLPAPEAARRIRASGIREELLAALDAWSAWEVGTGGTAWRARLAVAQAADDHAWRREFREALLRGDRPALVRLAGREESARQPAGAVLFLAGLLAAPPGGPPATAEERAAAEFLLGRAAAGRPGDARLATILAAWFPGPSRVARTTAVAQARIDQLKRGGASPALLADAYFGLGQLYYQRQDKAAAASAYREAVRLMPHRADYRSQLFLVCANQDELLAVCSDWIESGPASAEPYFLRGAMYRNRSMWQQALPDLVKATELDPNDPDKWDTRGQVHAALGQYKEAVAADTKALEAASRKGRNEARFWLSRGLAYKSLQQWDKAIADFDRAIALEPEQANYWGCRGQCYLGLGDTAKAFADYDMAIKHSSQRDGGTGFSLRAQLNEQLGRWDLAIADWTEWAKRAPNNPYPLTRRADLYRRRGRWDMAIADWTAAVKRAPNDAYYRSVLASLLVTCDDPAQRDPRQALRLALEDRPMNDPDLRWKIQGIARYQLGEWEEALAALNRVAERNNADVRFYLALAHWRLGHHEEARRWYDRGVQDNASRYGLCGDSMREAASLMDIGGPGKEPAHKTGP